MKRYVALGAVLTALGAGGAALVQGAAAGGSAAQMNAGGLSVMPAVIEHNAQPGQLATLTVANRSTAALAVTVTPRPWVQAVTGKVSPNRRSTLPGVSVSQTKFTLQPGAETQVTATLTSAPSAGYLYGAMEVVGVPTDAATRRGVVLGTWTAGGGSTQHFLDALVAPRLRPWRLGATMFTVFGVLAVVLAAIGLYSVLAYDVAERRLELGVRSALGAATQRLALLVIGRGVRAVAAGTVLGVLISLALGPRIAALLFRTSPRDPFVFVGVAFVLLVVAVAATMVPAVRAARVDPMEALRGAT